MTIRKHIIFHGSMQGVGFRWRARHAADLHGCTGWVHNKWNGTVEMEIQGEEEQIDRAIQSILCIVSGTSRSSTNSRVTGFCSKPVHGAVHKTGEGF